MNGGTPIGLWDWAVAAYARPGAKEALLALQDDHGVDVALVLWRAWLCAQGLAPTREAEIEALAFSDAWAAGVVDPLRAARTTLKEPWPGVDAGAALALRARVLEAELEAERLQLLALEALASAPSPEGAEGGDLADALAVFAPLRHVPVDDVNQTAALFGPD